MDPLSVTASVVGLGVAASKVTAILGDFINNVEDAPSLARYVLSEVSAISAILQTLKSFLSGDTHPPRRKTAIVLVGNLLSTLTGCVYTFSELEAAVSGLASSDQMNIISRVKWAFKEKTIDQLLGRLQNHKGSLHLMLGILHSQSDEDIKRDMEKLYHLYFHLLESHQDLSERLRRLEVTDLGRSWSIGYSDAYSLDETTLDAETIEANDFAFSFDGILNATRVYSRALFRGGGFIASSESVTSRESKLPVLYGISITDISDISDISVLNLPIYSSDISNSQHYSFESTAEDPDSSDIDGQTESSSKQDPKEYSGKNIAPDDDYSEIGLESPGVDPALPTIKSCINIAQLIDTAFLEKIQDIRLRSRKGLRSAALTCNFLIQLDNFPRVSHLPQALLNGCLSDIARPVHSELENILSWLNSYQTSSVGGSTRLLWKNRPRKVLDKYEDKILHINHYLSSALDSLYLIKFLTSHSIHVQSIYIDPIHMGSSSPTLDGLHSISEDTTDDQDYRHRRDSV